MTTGDKPLAHGPLAGYVKLRVAHALGMPGTFSPSLRVSDPDIHHGTCVRHVSWCMPGLPTSCFVEVGGGENVPGIPGTCSTHKFTYLVRAPLRKAMIKSLLVVFRKPWRGENGVENGASNHRWCLFSRASSSASFPNIENSFLTANRGALVSPIFDIKVTQPTLNMTKHGYHGSSTRRGHPKWFHIYSRTGCWAGSVHSRAGRSGSGPMTIYTDLYTTVIRNFWTCSTVIQQVVIRRMPSGK